MTKPKHRRCQVCHVVTSRYAGTQDAGAFVITRWVRDPTHGEVQLVNGTRTYCRAHTPQSTTTT